MTTMRESCLADLGSLLWTRYKGIVDEVGSLEHFPIWRVSRANLSRGKCWEHAVPYAQSRANIEQYHAGSKSPIYFW